MPVASWAGIKIYNYAKNLQSCQNSTITLVASRAGIKIYNHAKNLQSRQKSTIMPKIYNHAGRIMGGHNASNMYYFVRVWKWLLLCIRQQYQSLYIYIYIYRQKITNVMDRIILYSIYIYTSGTFIFYISSVMIGLMQ